jgi:uncharacterized membrane protein
MTIKKLPINIAALLSLILLAVFSTTAFAQEATTDEKPVVHAVLFFSPSCGHCNYVRTEVFPPLFEMYGDQLDILEIDISTADGNALFNQMLTNYSIPANYQGVPFLIIENGYLVGSQDIPAQFPTLVATELEGDGTTWPDLPGLDAFIKARDAQETEPDPAPSEEAQDSQNIGAASSSSSNQTNPEPSQEENSANDELEITPLQETEPDTPLFIQRFQRDLAGNSIAVAVLLGMIATVIYIGIVFMRAEPLKLWPWWVVPVLVVIGIGVAAYLSFVEVSGNEAICGPVGDCNAVQTSSYARLFGLIHIGVLGIIGYISIGAVWAIGRWGKEEWRSLANMAMFLLSLFGVLFSIYLTFLEPFVIGATCIWCISSAIIMTLLLLNSTPIALGSWMLYDDDYDYDDEVEDD